MDATETVVHIDRVRCLECGTKYVKPAGGGTVRRNPGCPRCGYVGWISALVPPPATTPPGPHRFAGDPHRRPAVQSR
jgi:ribosomal protein S27AE